jgi:hypothetical protein
MLTFGLEVLQFYIGELLSLDGSVEERLLTEGVSSEIRQQGTHSCRATWANSG